MNLVVYLSAFSEVSQNPFKPRLSEDWKLNKKLTGKKDCDSHNAKSVYSPLKSKVLDWVGISERVLTVKTIFKAIVYYDYPSHRPVLLVVYVVFRINWRINAP